MIARRDTLEALLGIAITFEWRYVNDQWELREGIKVELRVQCSSQYRLAVAQMGLL